MLLQQVRFHHTFIIQTQKIYLYFCQLIYRAHHI